MEKYTELLEKFKTEFNNRLPFNYSVHLAYNNMKSERSEVEYIITVLYNNNPVQQFLIWKPFAGDQFYWEG